jgi:undecaprenyl-diphosphatase
MAQRGNPCRGYDRGVNSLDEALFRAINQGPESLAPLMKFLSGAMELTWFRIVLGLLLVGMIARGAKSRRAAIQSLIAFPLANGFTDLFKHGLPEHRPFQILADVSLRVGWSDSMGTASAHSANMAAVATVMTFYLGGWGAIWILVAALVGYSRVYNGAHFPHQVLLGWTCGVVAGLLICYGWRAIVRWRQGASDEATGPGSETGNGSVSSK